MDTFGMYLGVLPCSSLEKDNYFFKVGDVQRYLSEKNWYWCKTVKFMQEQFNLQLMDLYAKCILAQPIFLIQQSHVFTQGPAYCQLGQVSEI